MGDFGKTIFASAIGKSEVWNFVRSLRKSLGEPTFNRPTIVALLCALQRLSEPLSLPTTVGATVVLVQTRRFCRHSRTNRAKVGFHYAVLAAWVSSL